MLGRSLFAHDQAPRLSDILNPDRNSFGFIRLALASTVVISHCYMLQAGNPAADPVTAITGYTSGQHAVQGFFVLSGLLVTRGLMAKKSIIDFACARSLRIFPGLIACVLMVALVLGPIVSALPPESYFTSAQVWKYIAATLTLMTGSAPLPGVFDSHPMPHIVNLSLWTLKFETVCYALLGLAASLVFASRWPHQIALTAGAITIAFLCSKHPALIESNRFIDSVRYFVLFFGTGSLLYFLRRHVVINGIVLTALAIAFAAAIGTRFCEVSVAVLLGYGMCWLSTLTFGPMRRFTQRHDLSYGIYIYSVPVTQTLLQVWPHIAVWPLVVATGVLVLPLAVASWLLVERPAMRLRTSAVARIEKLRQALAGAERTAAPG